MAARTSANDGLAAIWMPGDDGKTLTTCVTSLEMVPLLAMRVTLYDPVWAKTWLGFLAALADPSLKFHCQEVGEPVEVSVNCTAWPATGEAGA